MGTQRNEIIIICPVCLKSRKPQHPLCLACNRIFDQKKSKADRNGDIFLVTRLEYARLKANETLVRLREELAFAQKQKQEFYEEARELAKTEFKATGAMSVARQEFNRQAGKKFGELLGDPNRANEIWAIINGHEQFIKLVEEFIVHKEEDDVNSNEEPTQQVVNQEDEAA